MGKYDSDDDYGPPRYSEYETTEDEEDILDGGEESNEEDNLGNTDEDGGEESNEEDNLGNTDDDGREDILDSGEESNEEDNLGNTDEDGGEDILDSGEESNEEDNLGNTDEDGGEDILDSGEESSEEDNLGNADEEDGGEGNRDNEDESDEEDNRDGDDGNDGVPNKGKGNLIAPSGILISEPVGSSNEANEAIIVAIGATGAGKSQFLNDVADAKVFKVGHDLDSETGVVNPQTVSYVDGYGQNWRLTLVDTPGFQDTNMSDTEVLEKISDWMLSEYNAEKRVNGLIWFWDMKNARFEGLSKTNILMLDALVGDDAMANVVLCTNKWPRKPSQTDIDNEKKLHNEKWKVPLGKGAQHARNDKPPKSAKYIINRILLNHPHGATFKIQEELASGKKLNETGAGAEVNKAVLDVEKKYQDKLKKAQEDHQKALDASNKEWENRAQSKIDDLLARLKESDDAKQRLQRQLDTRTANERAEDNKRRKKWEAKQKEEDKKEDEKRKRAREAEKKRRRKEKEREKERQAEERHRQQKEDRRRREAKNHIPIAGIWVGQRYNNYQATLPSFTCKFKPAAERHYFRGPFRFGSSGDTSKMSGFISGNSVMFSVKTSDGYSEEYSGNLNGNVISGQWDNSRETPYDQYLHNINSGTFTMTYRGP
ncbi:hypothetical protein D9615_009642 [Tricholomella constricta]|uniref:G domain-containing protein n=1 Tax=Tricholomella constricta TaxID=117010 RepID=A0A8H5GUS1_9AGAR|nr:hypothetical protein D9615_009642 [Tricholomella constricta]